jgi:UDP-3-O-acyl N-acetylglucosamine deacetylase
VDRLNTLKKSFSLSGIGLHTGRKAYVHFKPIKNYGVFFKRTDIEASPLIAAKLENVNSTVRGTSLSSDGAEVHTVEHFLSVCSGLRLTGIEVRVNGSEVPILDSSSCGYADAVMDAGIVEFEGNFESLTVDKKITYRNDDDEGLSYIAEPAKGVVLNFTFLSDHPLLRHQQKEVILTPLSYIREIAPARTFVFSDEIACLRKLGLAKGGSLDNAVVVTREKFLTGDGKLHFEDEPVRHKILDLIGDLYLTGHPLKNIKISVVRGGHKYNVEFAKILLHKGVIE